MMIKKTTTTSTKWKKIEVVRHIAKKKLLLLNECNPELSLYTSCTLAVRARVFTCTSSSSTSLPLSSMNLVPLQKDKKIKKSNFSLSCCAVHDSTMIEFLLWLYTGQKEPHRNLYPLKTIFRSVAWSDFFFFVVAAGEINTCIIIITRWGSWVGGLLVVTGRGGLSSSTKQGVGCFT